MSFSLLLLVLHALQPELGKKKKKMQLGLSRRDNQPGAGGALESTIIDYTQKACAMPGWV